MNCKFGNVYWMTNLAIPKKFRQLNLRKTYNELAYPRFDNCNAISVSKLRDTPKDYSGLIGVPITILEYDPAQYEIVAADYELAEPLLLPNGKINQGRCYLNGKRQYSRIIIKLNQSKDRK